MIRQITYTIGEDMQLTPTAVQDAGVQGEHNATQIGFALPATLRTGYKLYLEALDGRGGYDRTSALTLTDGAVYTCLPREWTQAGGELTLRLVAKAVSADGTVTETVYTFEVRLRLRDRNIPENGVTPLLEQELQNAIAAGEQAKQAATTATEKAATATEKAKAAADSAAAAADSEAKATRLWRRHTADGRLTSTKHRGAGLGTQSVRSIAGQYGGLCRFEAKDGMFYASVLCPIRR